MGFYWIEKITQKVWISVNVVVAEWRELLPFARLHWFSGPLEPTGSRACDGRFASLSASTMSDEIRQDLSDGAILPPLNQALAIEEALPLEMHALTGAELESHEFLLDWASTERTGGFHLPVEFQDSILTGALEQLEMTMMIRAPDVRRFVASYDLHQLQAQATKIMNKKCIGSHLLAVGGYNIVRILSLHNTAGRPSMIRCISCLSKTKRT
jgi:hypothetical protein